MNKLFRVNSPLMRKLAQLPDLILLNLLWIICCLPVFTIGAATTALHTVVQKYVTEEEQGVIKPFFSAFRMNFRQSTKLWIPLCLLYILLAVDLLYLLNYAAGIALALWIPFLILGAIAAILLSYGFPLIARYDNDLKTVISNAFLLFSLHFFPSLGVIALNLLPWGLLLLEPNLFLRTSILWVFAGGSLISYIVNCILLPIFRKYDPKDPEDEQ